MEAQLGQVDAMFNNIALTGLEEANDCKVKAEKEDRADNVDVNW